MKLNLKITSILLGIAIAACLAHILGTTEAQGPSWGPYGGSLAGKMVTNVNIFSVTNVTIYDSLTVNTNVTVNQNLTVKGNATINNLIVSNSIQPISHLWPGASNTIDLAFLRQHFSCSSDISVTGFVHKTSSPTNAPFVLKVISTVGSISNCTLWLPANFIDLNYGSSYVFTNGIILSGEYDPNLGLTNGVARVW